MKYVFASFVGAATLLALANWPTAGNRRRMPQPPHISTRRETGAALA